MLGARLNVDSDYRERRSFHILLFLFAMYFTLFPVACATIQGYPKDPENTDATLTALQPYFDGTVEKEYLVAKDDGGRTQIRRVIRLRLVAI